MNKSESYQNCGLEELINYLKSIAEIEANMSYEDAPKQIMPRNKSESYRNYGLEELMDYVKSIVEIEANISYQDVPKQILPVQSKLIEVEVTAITTETPQQAKGEIIFGENEKVVSPSNLTNLVALIEDLQLSNGNLVKQVTYLSSAITEFHQNLESYKAQFQQAKSKLKEKEQELAANHQTIEKLTCELAIANQLVAQVQADYNEQSYQLSAEKDNCRDLRTRLNREQQHSFQLKVALEKCLEVPSASYQLADEMVSNADNADDVSSFAPKAPPIKPWTTQTRSGGNQIDLDWERQHFPDQNKPMASPEYVQPFSSLRTEDKFIDAIALTDIDEVQVASPIETNGTSMHKSPSPLVYPSRPPKGRKSLAAIELPSFNS